MRPGCAKNGGRRQIAQTLYTRSLNSEIAMPDINVVQSVIPDAGADIGLICAFAISPEGVREIELTEIDSAADAVLWLHFNLNNARARHLLSRAAFIPLELKEVLREQDARRRVDSLDTGLLIVMSDLAFEGDSDVAEVAPLWCYLGPQLFITARTHPLKTTDQLRSAMRQGLKVSSPLELLAWILAQRTATLRDIALDMTEHVGEIEDEILAGNIKQQREQ